MFITVPLSENPVNQRIAGLESDVEILIDDNVCDEACESFTQNKHDS